MTTRRRTLLTATLGFAQLEQAAPELGLLHRWLDTWSGVGAIAAGMRRVGWDVQLTGYGDSTWRATFWVTGMAHSIAGGSAWERTPWAAVQRAGWAALNKENSA